MSSKNGWVKWEGQCQVRMDRSDWKGNIKLKGLGQMRLLGQVGSVTYVRTYGVSDGHS